LQAGGRRFDSGWLHDLLDAGRNLVQGGRCPGSPTKGWLVAKIKRKRSRG
jgi:hypothetical protein